MHLVLFCYIKEIRVIITPDIEPIIYILANTFKFCFKLLFILNNTINPIPAPVQSPDIIEPNEMLPAMYNSVKSTEDAQLGIKPISPDMNGCNMLPLNNIFDKLFSPIRNIAVFKTKVTIKININMLAVCLSVGINMPF